MPLLKLWNAIRGRSKVEKPAANPAVSPHAPVVASKPAATGFSLFGGSPYNGLLKKVGKTGARSVLEISVGDGSRAIAVVDALAKKAGPVRYFGIDQFELAGGAVTLKDFHRTLRAAGVRAQLFPDAIDRGLVTFLHTIGTVDLVLLPEPGKQLEDTSIRHLLTRISHGGTTILYQNNDSWAELSSPTSPTSTLRRAA